MRCSIGMVSLSRSWLSVVVLVFVTLLTAGCGGSDDPVTAAVSGKVSSNGQPVNGGSVMFSPQSSADKKILGKPAAAEVGADGTFNLTTYAKNDGAVIGKHQVTYTPPPVAIDEAQHKEGSTLPVSPYAGLVPSKPEVEVKAGPNTIDIELIPNPKAGS